MRSLVFHPGVAYAFFGLVRLSLSVLVAVGLFYLLVKLAGLADAMTDAKRATSRSASSHAKAGSATE